MEQLFPEEIHMKNKLVISIEEMIRLNQEY